MVPRHTAYAAVLRGQAVQSKLIDHHNRRAPTLGTKLACQSFRRDRGSSSSKGFPKEDKRSGPQKKAWTPFFLLRVGFQRLSCTGRHSMRESSRSLDVAAGVVAAALGHQRRMASSWKFSLSCSSVEAPWVWLGVAWDETPMKLAFGGLAASLRQLARYWWRDGRSVQWRLLTQAECDQRGISRHRLSGVLETMGMGATLTWASWDDLPSSASREQWLAINREKLQLPPRVLPSSAAGHVCPGLG